MSIPATNYALEVLPALAVRSSTRLVLMLVAARANVRTAETYSGTWLSDATGMTPGSVRRALAELDTAGVIDLEHRAGRASVVRFPLAAYIEAITDEITDVRSYPQPAHRCAPSDPGTDVRGAHPCAPPRAPVRATPRTDARVSGLVSVPISAPVVDVLERFPRSGAHGIAILEEARNEQVAAQ